MNSRLDLPAALLRNTAAAAMLAGALCSAQAASFDVYARENSVALSSHDALPLDTGLVFTMGDMLHITATGSWNGGACGDVGPDGTACFGDWMPGINFYALVARVGNGDYFKVGGSYDGAATASGHLFLGFLDNDSFNNSGFVTATVGAVPEPGSYAMLMAGLGALGLAVRRRGSR